MKSSIFATALSGLLAAAAVCSGSPFATAVVQYNPGVGFAAGYTNPAAALGSPSRQTLDPTFGPSAVDPFAPPYLTNQIVSIGAGGSLTLAFDTPILRDASHPYGLDFLVFGHAGFDTAPAYNGIANGTIFQNGATQTVVSVSTDGTNFYQLDPTKAPVLDGLFPTDGLGDPGIPANPLLTGTNFAGLDLAGVRRLYAGSAGGAGYNLAWAVDSKGNPVNLGSIRFVRLEVRSGKADIDALSATSLALIPTGTSGWSEDFSSDPGAHGWAAFGDGALFSWNATNQNLEVTWDSSKPNSFYYRPLGTTLTLRTSFSVRFDLNLKDLAIGTESNKPGTFELALGLLNWQKATNAFFLRGTGSDSPDLAEFDYFPDSGFGPTIWPTITGPTSEFLALSYALLPVQPGTVYHVELGYVAGSNLLNMAMTREGSPYTNVQSKLAASPEGFSVDTFAIESYSSAGQTPPYGGSILAHGTLDNLQVTFTTVTAPSLSISLAAGAAQISFTSQSNRLYTLQRTTDFQKWTAVVTGFAGDGGLDRLTDTNPPPPAAFYRLQTQAP